MVVAKPKVGTIAAAVASSTALKQGLINILRVKLC
jgi:hypothetical protein